MDILSWLKKLVRRKEVENFPKLSWIRDTPDERDFKYSAPAPATLPARVDLRKYMPPVYDQGDIGSCTGQTIAAALEYRQKRQGKPSFTPSRLFIYWFERELEGTTNEDAGAQIRTGVKVVAKYGAPEEILWPYHPSLLFSKPTSKAIANADLNQALKYERVNQNELALKTALANGHPISFGIMVFPSLYKAVGGNIPLPGRREQCQGGHAILLVGYDDKNKYFIFRNSWGTKWGDNGYGYLPYNYVLNPNLAADFWTISEVE